MLAQSIRAEPNSLLILRLLIPNSFQVLSVQPRPQGLLEPSCHFESREDLGTRLLSVVKKKLHLSSFHQSDGLTIYTLLSETRPHQI